MSYMNDDEARDVRTVTTSPPSPRQCGRCRQFFPGDPTPDPEAPKWWLCSPCHTAFFGVDDGRTRAARWR